MRFVLRLLWLLALVLLSAGTVRAEQMENITAPSIVINLPSHSLAVYSGKNLIKEYPVAIGKPGTPTPIGTYAIIDKEINPDWIPPNGGRRIVSGPDNPLGYRWMGFLPLYGIHGTNAPWTIGSSVSNGCVRMQESDVEELFPVIPYGTVVQVIYDRITVRVSEKGQAVMNVYPDVYGIQPLTAQSINNRLAQYGLAGFLEDRQITALLTGMADTPVAVAQLVTLLVNERELREKGVLIDQAVYVPAWPVAVSQSSNIIWDAANQLVKTTKTAAPGIVKGDILYIKADNLPKLFDGTQAYDPERNVLDIHIF